MELLTHFPPRNTPPVIASAAEWRAHWPQIAATGLAPFDLAVRAGLTADRLAWAFGGGYQAAIRELQPQHLTGADTGSLCATEATGNRPRDIQSTLSTLPDGSLQLNGAKRWSTMSPVATHLFVLVRDATEGDAFARPTLKLVRVSAQAPGVRITPMPATAFTPELPHAELSLQQIAVAPDDVLPGDGWSDLVKPFRTLEDIFVSAACLSHLVRVACDQAWPQTLVEDSLSALAALQVLASQPPGAAATHIALAGTLRSIDQVYAAVDAHCANAPASAAVQAWQRDRKLFGLSAKTRGVRTERAWSLVAA
ncbi:hypothetical protein CCO03_07135 [Comamonas serinivorans]|uniref:Acyl-CoA oxidase/dehydrogenase middle domain-containing protein n=1 Tax=Comamonas serinivorans TaxID=1082851 RepID=A0A1Y0ELJ4_9BURK|nr:acyl-CoA dehydrogenase family protein [Comamonas serinivorans]ARU04477.1 hypothetical protein CCO03_07135 [Comamonas serinivorans]